MTDYEAKSRAGWKRIVELEARLATFEAREPLVRRLIGLVEDCTEPGNPIHDAWREVVDHEMGNGAFLPEIAYDGQAHYVEEVIRLIREADAAGGCDLGRVGLVMQAARQLAEYRS